MGRPLWQAQVLGPGLAEVPHFSVSKRENALSVKRCVRVTPLQWAVPGAAEGSPSSSAGAPGPAHLDPPAPPIWTRPSGPSHLGRSVRASAGQPCTVPKQMTPRSLSPGRCLC